MPDVFEINPIVTATASPEKAACSYSIREGCQLSGEKMKRTEFQHNMKQIK